MGLIKMSDRKICYEELFDKFQTAAKDWLKETPEAKGLILVVDWKVGKNDFPASIAVSEPPTTERNTLDMLKQAIRLVDHLSNVFAQQVTSVEGVLNQAEHFVKQSQATKPNSG
jgi:hypothetical protein